MCPPESGRFSNWQSCQTVLFHGRPRRSLKKTIWRGRTATRRSKTATARGSTASLKNDLTLAKQLGHILLTNARCISGIRDECLALDRCCPYRKFRTLQSPPIRNAHHQNQIYPEWTRCLHWDNMATLCQFSAPAKTGDGVDSMIRNLRSPVTSVVMGDEELEHFHEIPGIST